MTAPSKKSPEMERYIDLYSKKMFGKTRTTAIYNDVCVICGGDASRFKDTLSRKEYSISGLCQTCQDKTFE